MPSVSLQAARRAVGALIDPRYQLSAATGGDATTLSDTVGLLDSARGRWYVGGWLKRGDTSGTTTAVSTTLQDTFGRADSATVVGGPTIGSASTQRVGTWGLLSGQLYSSSRARGDLITWPANRNGILSYTTTGGFHNIVYSFHGGVCRYDPATGNFLRVDLWNGKAWLMKVQGGIEQTLTSAPLSLTDNATYSVGIVLLDAVISVFVGGILIFNWTLSAADQALFNAAGNSHVGFELINQLDLNPSSARSDNLSMLAQVVSMVTVPAADLRERHIAADDPTNGVVTVGTPWTVAPAAGAPYEIYGVWQPSRIESAIRRALTVMPIWRAIDVVGVAGQRQYALSQVTYPALTSLGQVRLITHPTGNALQQIETPMQGARVTSSNGLLTLDLQGYVVGDGETIRLWVDQAEGDIALAADGVTPSGFTLDTDTVLVPSLTWLVMESVLEALKRPVGRYLSGAGLQDLRLLRDEYELEVAKWRALYAQPLSGPLFTGNPGWGSDYAAYPPVWGGRGT